MSQALNILRKLGLCMGQKGTLSAVDTLCAQHDAELLEMKSGIEKVHSNCYIISMSIYFYLFSE